MFAFLATVGYSSAWCAGENKDADAADASASPSEDVIRLARRLASNGEQESALRLLAQYLQKHGSDADARLLYGIVLSRQKRYSEARQQLEAVLAEHPHYDDAFVALINVELWSGRLGRAEQLIRQGLRDRPDDPIILPLYIQLLRAEGKHAAAEKALARYLAEHPEDQQALRMREGLSGDSKEWRVRIDHDTEWFNEDRDVWRESRIELQRETSVGPVITRFSQAKRFSTRGRQVEVDFYPTVRKGAYLYLNVGRALGGPLYPTFRAGAEIYQSLNKGFEGSIGLRRARFFTDVNTYTGSLSKYYGHWLFTGRTYITPALGENTRSYHVSARRYIRGETGYAELRYGRGSSIDEIRSIDDIQVLDAKSLSGSLVLKPGRIWGINLRLGYRLEDRIQRQGLRRHLLGGGVYLLF